MQKWEISKRQSAADTAIKGSQLEPEQAWGGVWCGSGWSLLHIVTLRESTHHIMFVLLAAPSSCPRRFAPSHLVLRHLVCSEWQPLENRVGVSIRRQQGTHRLLAHYPSRFHPRHLFLWFTVWMMRRGHEVKLSELTPKCKRNSELK